MYLKPAIPPPSAPARKTIHHAICTSCVATLIRTATSTPTAAPISPKRTFIRVECIVGPRTLEPATMPQPQLAYHTRRICAGLSSFRLRRRDRDCHRRLIAVRHSAVALDAKSEARRVSFPVKLFAVPLRQDAVGFMLQSEVFATSVNILQDLCDKVRFARRSRHLSETVGCLVRAQSGRIGCSLLW